MEAVKSPGIQTPTKSKRQEDKLKAKLAKDLWFVVKWIEEEEDLFDVLCAKDLSVCGKDVCRIAEGDVGDGKFGKGSYPVRILAKGSYSSMVKRRDQMEEAVDSSSEATCKTPTKERASVSKTVDTAVLDTTMEVEQSSSDNGCTTDADVPCVVTATSSKKDDKPSKTSTPKRKRCLSKKMNVSPKSKKPKGSRVKDKGAVQDAKKAATLKAAAKSQGKELENVESSKRIFSQLDSSLSAYTSKAVHADDFPSFLPSLHSASSATVYPTSSFSNSPGPSDAATSFSSASPASERARTSFSPVGGNPGFSQYLQEQRRTPFMPMPARLSPPYSYPPVAHYGMQQEVPNIAQLTTCLYELMGEIRTIKHDLKRVRKRKVDRQDSLESDSSQRPSLSPSPAPTNSNSCLLGNPHGDHVKIDGFTQRQVKGKEVLASNASSLALKLMDLFFTKEEMARGNCTPAEGRDILRQDIIAGIRCHINYVYPSENSATHWKEILHKKMNSKCRNHRSFLKKDE